MPEMIVKREYEPFGDDSGALADLFDETDEVIVDDDVTIMITNNVFPMPVKTTTEDLKKRSDDWFSGNLPYNSTVNTKKMTLVSEEFSRIV